VKEILMRSKVFFACCLFFLAGVALASFELVNLAILFFAVAVCAAFFIFYDKNSVNERALFVLSLMFFLAGVLRYTTYEDVLKKENDAGFLTGQKMELVGVVDQEPEFSQKSQRLVVVAERAIIDGFQKEISGRVLVVLPPYPQFAYGDKIAATGKLESPQNTEEFAEKEYLAKEGIFSEMVFAKTKLVSAGNGSVFWKNIYAFKERIKENIAQYLVEPQAAFLGGLLIGAKESLPKDFKDDLSKSGTSHIVALSGYNIMIVATAVMGALVFLGATPTIGFWATMFFIFAFTIFCGAQASLVRAAIMGCLVLIAKKEGRVYNIRNALLLAAALMIFLNPKILRFDASFQLSFLALLGLVYFSPILKKKLSFVPEFLRLRETLSETLAAQLFVLPLLVLVFGRFSLISPLSNILILVMIPYTMLLGFILLVFSFFFVPLAKVFAFLSWLLLSYEIFIIERTAALPFSALSSPAWSLLFMVLIYVGIAFVIFPHKINGAIKKLKKIYSKA
jgi:competence protein ComEC